MTTATKVHGVCDERFSRLRNAFVNNFETGQEIGACLALTIDGETVVELWAGHADPALTQPWERDTIACTYSTTKGMVATCANRLADQEGAREMIVPPYHVAHRVAGDVIEILKVWHGKRMLRPEEFD